MMDYIFDYILENWPNLTVVIIYFIIFLPIIFINIGTVIIIIISPFIFSVFPLIPKKYINSIKLNKKHQDNLGKLGFSLGQNTRKLQKYLTDEFPFILIRRTTIMSIQKRMLNLYITLYESAIKGSISGIKSGRDNNNVNNNWENWNIYKKIITYPIFVISTFLFSIFALIISSILLLPTIIFVFIIIDIL